MPDQIAQSRPRAWARAAGALWLITIVGGVFAEYFVRGQLIVRGDAAATAHNILAAEPLYRLGFAVEFAGIAAYAALTAILYVLLKPVGRNLALIATVFSVMGCTIGVLNLVNHMAPLVILSGANGLAAIPVEQLQALSFAFLKLRTEELNVGLMCFGLQCVLTGWLIFRSTFLPRLLGALLTLGGAGYLISGYASVLALPLERYLSLYGYLPGVAAEALLALWLVVVGVNARKWTAAASSPYAPNAGFAPSNA